MKARFYRAENTRWYYHFPEYLNNGGDVAELEMVSGADIMLDILSEDADEYECYVSREWMKDFDACLIKRSNEKDVTDEDFSFSNGADYTLLLQDTQTAFLVWLCSVTTLVFGDFPGTLFLKTIK